MTTVCLFGLTGLGNNALAALLKSKYDVQKVYTRKHDAPYPYYECEQLDSYAKASGIDVGYDVDYNQLLELNPDLIVVAAWKNIILRRIIDIPRYGVINIHPSLLPKYRGATPTFWAILNEETETGITIHFIEDENLDSGRIILQKRMQIDDADTDGTLLEKLTKLSEGMLPEAIELVITRPRDSFLQQDESKATMLPKRTKKDTRIHPHMPRRIIMNILRAATPYPGAYYERDGI